jgi:hypothetical protein
MSAMPIFMSKPSGDWYGQDLMKDSRSKYIIRDSSLARTGEEQPCGVKTSRKGTNQCKKKSEFIGAVTGAELQE